MWGLFIAGSPFVPLWNVLETLALQSFLSSSMSLPVGCIALKGGPKTHTLCSGVLLVLFLGKRHLEVTQHRPHSGCSRQSRPAVCLSPFLCPCLPSGSRSGLTPVSASSHLCDARFETFVPKWKSPNPQAFLWEAELHWPLLEWCWQRLLPKGLMVSLWTHALTRRLPGHALGLPKRCCPLSAAWRGLPRGSDLTMLEVPSCRWRCPGLWQLLTWPSALTWPDRPPPQWGARLLHIACSASRCAPRTPRT